ncbi:3-hydroxyacyl-CoA dehydrogenase NAD-binding domain-containing protein [Nitratireductor indicus]|uniref:3-hydroxyacyl-CoA dehydrogenase NAD-binding domain-containing protein n=1 Tax=Nitratireductor indicus TaxID=721133 RepID=UPI0028758BBC|nr:3-hydroxyacyl-CoA dehydrogenase NAD-binding domain-containing protein [Nitratireductor indicus]MDS1134986.1 3-hydroxyacyl-CoA dehydrogenase NAD-binding domain-containing protein [Nitratireductor indicus]
MVRTVAVVGCGTVGASWAALFLAGGYDVVATDPAPGAEAGLMAFIARARPQLAELGLAGDGALSFTENLEEAVASADFVQENAPENEAFKRDFLARIDALAPEQTIVASSTSALLRSRIVADCARKHRHIVAHPFNPPHLLPLVEIIGEDDAVVERACAFYRSLGRRPIVLKREAPGHIANRLSSALYREAVSLVEQGIASVADIDAAVSDGPGLRWAIMGPHMTYHLGGGAGGIAHYLDHLGPSQERRWASLGTPQLNSEVKKAIVEGVEEEAQGRDIAALEAERDRLLSEIVRLKAAISSD